MFCPAARYSRTWSGHILVLSPGRIPTVDFYLTKRLCELGDRVAYYDSRIVGTVGESCLPDGIFVIIVRHAAAGWLRLLKRRAGQLSGVAFLMDDDIPGAWRCPELPLDYAAWTAGRYFLVRRLLSQVCDRIWFSTSALQARYPMANARVLAPMEPAGSRAAAPAGVRRWGYHGTRVHAQEIRWVIPIVEAVQAADEAHEFEIFGGPRIARWFSHIPRVHILPPRAWPEYLEHCRASSLAVGIAPLLPGRFNAFRSHVKIFDIARCGAVGVFSDREPYRSVLRDGKGLLVGDEPAAWIEAVTSLLRNDSLRLQMYGKTAAWADKAGKEVRWESLIPGMEARI